MKRLLLVRHGETEWNRQGRFQGHTDIELNEEGRAQARSLAARLLGKDIVAVASSDLRRAHETAKILAEPLSLPVAAVDPDLRERSYGAFEGLTREECMERYPEAWKAAEAPGAEPRHLVTTRLARSVTRLLDAHGRAHARIVIVSHGGAIRQFLHGAIGIAVPPIPNLGVYELTWDGRDFGEPFLW
ncbi:MAG: histidine phosphatase family protein [Polyangiales bacterium]